MVRLAWSEPLSRFAGVRYSYGTRASSTLVVFDGAGDLEQAVDLRGATEYEFTPAGDVLVVATIDERERSSACEVVALPDARVVWQFRADVPAVE